MRYNQLITFTFLYLIVTLPLQAQLEEHTWFFGGGTVNTRPGMRFDFTTNQPAQYNEVRYPLGLQENNIMVANPSSGEIGFYSDGQLVIDASHQPMPNGTNLNGSPSAMYGSAVVFDPSGCDRYFLITVQSEDDAIPRKIYYSAIDLALPGNGTLTNPLGDVDNFQKNVEFTPTGVDCTEGLFAISKAGSTKDSWLFFGDRNEPILYLYQITTTGINYYDQFDLESLMPTLLSGDLFSIKMDYYPLSESTGRLIIAPGRNVDSEAFPVASYIFNIEDGSFEPNTYQLIEDRTYWTYGTAFSPDGSKLYISDYIRKTLKQYDFNTSTLSTIATSSHNGRTGGVKTGPDGRTYWSNVFVNFGSSPPVSRLSVVNNPNEPGLACNLSLNSWTIGATINSRIVGALPTFGTFPDPPFVEPLSPDVCSRGNGSAIIDPAQSTPPLSYQWDNGETTAFVDNLTMGLHEVTVTDGIGCEKVLEVFIEKLIEEVDIEIGGNAVLCAEGMNFTILDVGASFDSYLWSTGEEGHMITVDMPGVYSVTVSTEGGCMGETSIEVVAEEIDVEIGGDAVLCDDGENLSILDGGAGFDSYLWSNGEETQTIVVDMPGEYNLIVSSADGCTGETSIEVVQVEIEVSIGGDPNLCSDGDVSTLLNGGEGFDSYLWSTGEVSQEITVEMPGLYTVSVSTEGGCEGEANIEVVQENIDLEIFGDTIICATGEETLLLGEEGFDSYEWSNGVEGEFIVVDTAGIYTLTVSSLAGCTGEKSIEVVEEVIDVGIMGDTTVCEMGNTNTMLTATDGFNSYLWSNGAVTQSILVDTPGIYDLTVVSLEGCIGEEQIEVLLEQLYVEIEGDTTLCNNQNDLITLAVDAGYTELLWSNQNYTSSILVSDSGVYSVTATNSKGCIAIDSISIIEVSSSLDVVLPELIEVDFGESSVLNPMIESTSSYSILWSPSTELSCDDCSMPTIDSVIDNLEYQIFITDVYGCVDSASVTLSMVFDKGIYSPNVFTPNNDGSNNAFTLYGTSSIKEIKKLLIYDRWGDLIFEQYSFPANEEQYGWSGRFNGQLCNSGVFVWMAEVEFYDGAVERLAGDLLLLR